MRATTPCATYPSRHGNEPGQFWVDESCIDCDTCRWMMSPCFSRRGEGSIVYRQPVTREERIDAARAMISCPTAWIHADKLAADELKKARDGLPQPVPGVPNIFHCGWHSTKSFAASPWFIQSDKGNVMVDSPRFSEPLARQIELLGGLSHIFLTHKDDVGDHSRWKERFLRARRIIYSTEAARGDLVDCEIQLGPWNIEGMMMDPVMRGLRSSSLLDTLLDQYACF